MVIKQNEHINGFAYDLNCESAILATRLCYVLSIFLIDKAIDRTVLPFVHTTFQQLLQLL